MTGAQSEIARQLADLIRTATAMREQAERGESPDLSDARILRSQAQCAEHLVELEGLARLHGLQPATPAADKDAQMVMARAQHARVDAAESANDEVRRRAV